MRPGDVGYRKRRLRGARLVWYSAYRQARFSLRSFGLTRSAGEAAMLAMDRLRSPRPGDTLRRAG